MEQIEYTTTDKSDWGEGEWQHEPDKIQYPDPPTGLPCLVTRGPSGALCGYLGVPPEHPWYRQDYGSVEATVHGGLTFAGFCMEGPEEEVICHIPAPGEPDDVWWLGFDCAHAMDYLPGMEARMREHLPDHLRKPLSGFGEVYRNLSYVKAECSHLARQAAEAALVPSS